MKTHEAIVEAILIAADSDTFVTQRVSEVSLEFGGIAGDRHFGLTRPADARQPMYPRGTEIFNRRQISIVSVEDCQAIGEKLQLVQVQPEWLGANLLVKGIPDLTLLPIGSRILFPSGAGLICQGENLPCMYPGKVIQNLHQNRPKLAQELVGAAKQKRGIVCLVEHPGIIHQADAVKILINDFSKPMQ